MLVVTPATSLRMWRKAQNSPPTKVAMAYADRLRTCCTLCEKALSSVRSSATLLTGPQHVARPSRHHALAWCDQGGPRAACSRPGPSSRRPARPTRTASALVPSAHSDTPPLLACRGRLPRPERAGNEKQKKKRDETNGMFSGVHVRARAPNLVSALCASFIWGVALCVWLFVCFVLCVCALCWLHAGAVCVLL